MAGTGKVYDREVGAFLPALDEPARSALMAIGRQRKFPKGAVLFAEGQTSDRVMVVLSGRVKVSYLTEDGKEVVLGLAGPGELLGEMSFLDRDPHSASNTALDLVETLVVTSTSFQAYLGQHPGAALALLRLLSRRLRESDQMRVEFAAHDSVGRVARRLVELAERFGQHGEDNVKITLQLSQEEMAGWIGSSREAVNKALAMLRTLGWIETQRRGVTILDMPSLRHRAAG
jgi:CRP/FNR family cyclic AMP-dependent transcriptional regulator